MKPVEEIAREVLAGHSFVATDNRRYVGLLAEPVEARIVAALRAERERADAALTLVGIRTETAHEALARAEKAEAERDEKVTDLFDRLRDVEAERDVAESALATARNRALEEAAECVKDCRQWEPECPHAARILSLRIPEAST